MRALQAWVQDRVGKIRSDLAVEEDAGQEIEETPTKAAARHEVRIAALEPAVYLTAAQAGGSVELAQQSRSEGCESGTFWQQFFCEGEVLFKGVSGVVASILGTRVELSADTVLLAGVAKSCEAFRLTPKSADFKHVETGILPGTARRMPRGLYCVLCRTSEDGLQPYSTLDLVKDKDARPAPVADEAARCTVNG